MAQDLTPPDFSTIEADPFESAQRRGVLARMRRHPALIVGGVIVGLIVLAAIFAPLLAPHDPYMQSLAQRRIPPIWHAWMYDAPKAGWSHPLGTDNLGRDYLSRLLYGARISLTIGTLAMLISGVIGSTIGIAAGYFGGRTDLVVSFLITTRLSVPLILVALAVVSLYGGSIEIIVAVLGLLLWDRFAVVLRSVTLQARGQEYVTAARAVGCSTPFIILSEILPNIVGQLIVVATVEMGLAILLEATLSFLGLGVQPPEPSWGLMLDEARTDMLYNPWMITVPGVALFTLIFGINMLGDGIRDVTAPEQRS